MCAVIAGIKGRNPFGWGILGLFFSILTLIVIVVIPSKNKKSCALPIINLWFEVSLQVSGASAIRSAPSQLAWWR